MRNKKGFTLIEMLVVIAIIAILVSIVIPTVSSATNKAKAAADAANLRVVYSELNIHVINGEKTVPEILATVSQPTSKIDPEAKISAVFDAPGFIEVYYVNGSTYYGLDYLSDVATNGESDLSISKPATEGVWYQTGVSTPIG